MIGAKTVSVQKDDDIPDDETDSDPEDRDVLNRLDLDRYATAEPTYSAYWATSIGYDIEEYPDNYFDVDEEISEERDEERDEEIGEKYSSTKDDIDHMSSWKSLSETTEDFHACPKIFSKSAKYVSLEIWKNLCADLVN